MYTYRRIMLDKLQNKYNYLYKGVVLDIGGRDRGDFKKPKTLVEKWIFVDIVSDHDPDLISDVADMKNIKSESADVVNAIELFEHVERIEDGLNECFRVLKKGGIMIISIPFLYPVHADPYDYQRWTNIKWNKILENIGFKVEDIVIMGRYFTVLAEMIKFFIKAMPSKVRKILYFLIPVLNLVIKIDDTKWVKQNKLLSNFHGGYFIVLKK